MTFARFKGLARTLSHFANVQQGWPVIHIIHDSAKVPESQVIISYTQDQFSIIEITPPGYDANEKRSARSIFVNDVGKVIHYDDSSNILDTIRQLRQTGKASVRVIKGFHIWQESPADPEAYAQEQGEEFAKKLIARSTCATPESLGGGHGRSGGKGGR